MQVNPNSMPLPCRPKIGAVYVRLFVPTNHQLAARAGCSTATSSSI
jgi:hypothetical protein